MLISDVQAIPIFNFMKSNESPKSIKLRCDFAVDTLYEVLLTQERQLTKFETARCIYFDASGCVNDVLFECLETGQRITFKAGKQGYRNVLISMGMRFRLTGTSPDVFLGNLLNVDMPESEWPLDTSIPDSIPLSSLAYAAAQFDVIGRKTAGAGAWEDCSRTELNIAGTDLANTFSQNNIFERPSGTAATLTVRTENATPTIACRRASSDAGAPSFSAQKTRGTLASPTVLATNDVVGDYNFQAYNGSSFTLVSRIRSIVSDPSPSATSMGTNLIFSATPNTSTVLTEAMRLDHQAGWQAFGTNTVLDTQRLFRRRAFTFATLPAAASSPNGFAVITDGAAAPVWNAPAAGGGAVRTPVWSTGAAWQNG